LREKEEVLTLELVPARPRRIEATGRLRRQIANRFKIADHGRPATAG